MKDNEAKIEVLAREIDTFLKVLIDCVEDDSEWMADAEVAAEAIRKRVAAFGMGLSKWVSVDTPPKVTSVIGQDFLIIDKYEAQAVAFYLGDRWVTHSGIDPDEITHWQPLPTPPEETEVKE